MDFRERKGICGFLFFLGLCSCLLIFIPDQRMANAELFPDPSTNVPICTAAGSQYAPKLIKVNDGYIVSWQDERRVYRDIYAQKFDLNFNMKWGDNGRVIAAGNNGEASNQLVYNSQSLTGIVSDTQGGAIVLWTEDYTCASGPCGNGWITRIHANGTVQWGMAPTPGVTIQGTDTAVKLNSHAHADAIAPDGEGGAFGILDVDPWGSWYVFRMDANGAYRGDTSGAVGARGASSMIYGGNSNGKDYVNIAWWDYGEFAISVGDPEVNYPASLDTLSARWSKVTLSTTPAWWSEPVVTSDGAGGMIMVWEDGRNGNSDLFAQKISANGTVQWTSTGVPIAVQADTQRRPQIVSDGAGGAVMVWEDFRPPYARIYAQHIGADGTPLWAANGIPISSSYGQVPKIIRSDGGTYIVVWVDTDANGGTKDYLRAQKIDTAGTLLWPADSRTPSGGTTGVVISEIYSDSFDIASDGGSGLIAVWELGGDLYAKRVTQSCNDFNSDGRLDILWQHGTTGALHIWTMNGTSQIGVQALNPSVVADTNWKIVGTGDFNGDGYTDLVWYYKGMGMVGVWLMNWTDLSAAAWTTPNQLADTNWNIVGIGDFNGDGHPDIVWQHDAGTLGVWLMNGTTMTTAAWLTPNQLSDPAWRVVGVGDFNGDGKPDLLWYHTVGGWLGAWLMDGTTMTTAIWLTPSTLGDMNWRVAGVGDFNADGKPDILWQHSTGSLGVWLMNGTTMTTAQWLTPSSVSDTNWRIVGPK